MAERKNKKKSGGRLGVTLFGGIFLLVGLGLIVVGPLETFYQHMRSAGWQRVPVTLHSINVESHRGDDSTTYSVEARYSYQFNGHTYNASRVGYDWGSDNIGDYHGRIVGRVRSAQARGQLLAWVNPADPHEAYLMRDLRWKKIIFMVIFGAVFAGAGAGVIAFGWRNGASPTDGSGAIDSSERYGHWVLAFMAFMFIGISFPVVMELPAELRKQNWLILVALIFPLAGLGMAWGAWAMRKKWLHYGPLPLQLDPAPGQVGGDVAGEISLPKWYGDDCWQVTLKCIRVRISGGKNRSRSESVVWQQQQAPFVEARGTGSALRFVFSPPSDLPPSDDEGREQVEWRLVLNGPKQPVALERTYGIPVVEGTARTSRALPRSHVDRSEKKAAMLATAEASAQIDVEQLGDGLRLHSRVGRNLSMTLVVMLAGAGFAGGGVGLFFEAAKEGFMLYVMSTIFSLIGFPLFLGGVFMLARSLDASIQGDQVETVRYWLGRPVWRRQARLTSAAQLQLKDAGSSSSGNRTTEYFHLVVAHEGRKVRIAEGLQGRDVAEALRDNLIRLLRLP